MQGMDIRGVEARDKSKQENTQTTGRHQPKSRNTITDLETIKILQQVERLLGKGDNLECINLLRALKDNMQGVKSQNLHVLVAANLGILFYQVGFLEEAQEEILGATQKLRELSQKLLSSRKHDLLRLKYDTMLGKLELQLCILFSEMGKHDLALEHAKASSKVSYNLIYDLMARLTSNLVRTLISKGYPRQQQPIGANEGGNILNSIVVLNHLLASTKDLKLAFATKERVAIAEDGLQSLRRFGTIPAKVDLQQLYAEDQGELFWIYKNKILDEIQLVPFEVRQLEESQEVGNSEVVEKITYLAISLYCYSTETRFLQKGRQCESHDVLDSEHWLSRSLQIAYSFLPPEAPILNQIITVHDRFHGLDKQTIPEDQQVTGFFKVLRPLSKPKSTYNAKNPGSSPIMIRIQADKVDVRLDGPAKTARDPGHRPLIELEQSGRTIQLENITRNNRIRNYSHGHKRIQSNEAQLRRPSLSSRTTIDIPQLHNPNVRTNYANKKFSRHKEEKLRVNFSELNGKAVISEDLLARPEEAKSVEAQMRALTQKRRKSLPTRKSEPARKPMGVPIKFEGLQLKGHRLDETIEGDLFLQQEPGTVQTTRLGGNVYINNNINLFISRQPEAQTFVRGQVVPQRRDADKDLSRRQLFLNKRRANNFLAQEEL